MGSGARLLLIGPTSPEPHVTLLLTRLGSRVINAWQVLRYFDAMRKAGGSPSARTYERAVEACDRVDADRALILFAEMKASGL